MGRKKYNTPASDHGQSIAYLSYSAVAVQPEMNSHRGTGFPPLLQAQLAAGQLRKPPAESDVGGLWGKPGDARPGCTGGRDPENTATSLAL